MRFEFATATRIIFGPGTLVEIARHTLPDEFRHIDSRRARVQLVEGGPRVLGAFDASLSASAQHQLQRLGVEVLTGQRVTAIDAEGVTLQQGEAPARRLAARTGHYMPPTLLRSQFAALEEPSQAIVADISPPAEEIAERLAVRLTAGQPL